MKKRSLLLAVAIAASAWGSACQALSRSIEIEPVGFIAGKMNLQYEMKTAPQRSLSLDGAVLWDNQLGKASYAAVGAGLRRYVAESFQGPWYGGKLQYINWDENQLVRTSLLGGFKWVGLGSFTQEFFVGARIDQYLGGNDPTQLYPLVGYSIGYTY